MDLVLPQPLWSLKNELTKVYPSLKQDLACDVAIPGGEITIYGCS